ncbi:MAG: hypothetical protein ABW039_02480 [Sphingobium sp.]
MRFLFALLIACLSLPAVAAQPCAPVVPANMVTGMAHHGPDGQLPVRGHDCIGCIAPIDGLSRPMAPFTVAIMAPGIVRNDRDFARVRNCPATPPPKPLA